jgi:hypothetical protein
VYGSAVAPRLRCALVLLAVAGAAGCADDDERTNGERPAATINVTAAIADGRIHVSPRRFGAGPIRLIVSNQTQAEQEVTLATGGNAAGVTRTSTPIRAAGTGTLQMDVPEGDYELRTADREIEPTALSVGTPRPSAQDQLLLP